jgi:long-chain fatty acid transport protein
MTLAPSVAYRIGDRFSVGASLHAMYGVFDFTTAVNNVSPVLDDGSLAFDDTTWGYGGRIGLLYELDDSTRIGVAYQSKITLDFEGTPQFDGLGPVLETVLGAAGLLDAGLDLSMEVPQGVMASAYGELGSWSLMGNVGWEEWSKFGKVGVSVASDATNTLTYDRNYEDTWHVAVGAQRRFDRWTLSFGTAWDSSVVDDEDRTVDLPLGPGLRLGVGGTLPPRGRVPEMVFSYEVLWGGDLSVDQFRGPLAGRVAGDYEQTALHFFGASFRWGASGSS